MDNQHRHIKGYRELTIEEIDTLNRIKELGAKIEGLVEELRAVPEVDERWINIGVTNLQQGLMALTRSVAKPTTF